MSDAVEEVKRRIDLVEYIGRVTKLQRTGRNFRGLCPFHTEKTPSFYVFPERGTWRCFGSCGEGGDLFSFVQKRENLDFRAALRQLAAEAGVQLSAANAARRSRGDHLAGIVSAAVDYYQRAFASAAGAAAREYIFGKRRLGQETVDAFRIGWAENDWRHLRDYLLARGYDERDAIAAGLLVEPDSGGQPYDRFRGRVIIPIADERGQYVAMGGRGLQGEEPKYLNSPQTEIFDKGHILFALHLAAPEIRASGVAVVVEGYMDVMGPWQAGFRNVVATMGTALTPHHVALLRRHARRVVLAMDPDAAGMAAAERAGALLSGIDSPDGAANAARSAQALTAGTEIELRVAPLPPGKDPDEVAHEDPEGWRRAISGAIPYAEFLLNRLMERDPSDSPLEARRVVDRLKPVLLAVQDPVERAMYVQRIARRLGVAETAVFERLSEGMTGRRRPPLARERVPERSQEEWLLSVLLHHPMLRREFGSLPESLFSNAIDREVYRRWAHGEEAVAGEGPDPVTLRAHELEAGAARMPPLTAPQAAAVAREKIREISRERIILHQAAVTEQLAEAERSVGAGELARLGAEVWRGLMPPPEQRELAETLLEAQQLGQSIHRREEPDRA